MLAELSTKQISASSSPESLDEHSQVARQGILLNKEHEQPRGAKSIASQTEQS
ncbi:MAG: hypothetical protein LBT76_06325 [Tannerella sp.]|jgi:hypothetical protein|nr:hypothetical protein [Tannerella sp.]